MSRKSFHVLFNVHLCLCSNISLIELFHNNFLCQSICMKDWFKYCPKPLAPPHPQQHKQLLLSLKQQRRLFLRHLAIAVNFLLTHRDWPIVALGRKKGLDQIVTVAEHMQLFSRLPVQRQQPRQQHQRQRR